METQNINDILCRTKEESIFINALKEFETGKKNNTIKRGIYVYGNPGVGKTMFVINILKQLNYDIVKYDAGDIRNKSIIDTMATHNMADKNIISMYYKKVKYIAIVMDEIDGMNSGDKGGINSLIKIIRPKKTKKQKVEDTTMNPIICIGNHHIDKKIKELMKVCHVIELKPPTDQQITTLIDSIPEINISPDIKANIVNYIQGDLRKFKNVYDMIQNNSNILTNNSLTSIFLPKSYNDDTRNITKQLLNNNYSINEHSTIMNDTDRTIVSLLWHENIVDLLEKMPKSQSVPFYLEALQNICVSDYIDRITFKKQIWQFNEMSSLIKTFKNNKLYHGFANNAIKKKEKEKYNYNPTEVRFTKVLTKYSTEYNNNVFIQNMCQNLCMDKSDLLGYFLSNNADMGELTKLDINRIHRYIDKHIKEDAIGIEINDEEQEELHQTDIDDFA